MDNKLPLAALEKITKETNILMEQYNKSVEALKTSYDDAHKLRKEFLVTGIEFTKIIENGSKTEEKIVESYTKYKKLLEDRANLSKALLSEINTVLVSVDEQLLLLDSPYEPKFGIQTQNPRVFKTNKSNPNRNANSEDAPVSGGSYCICNGPAYGDMVACDAFHMEIPWYHMECVGLSGTPRGHWLCPKCKPSE
ncbi:hypothetical protein NEMIN01_1913 [Nematocida minor]|uniref:uncharacterized protein n=1 Tax=Nematocida minor TaxID=1912983 RepID=UPI0022200F97|nr:uncharacterized protein NEMIN01_1913 [Nematocida minor]KAI5192261.1 hypothetical protein NEMIN01_1913 [Nematocida minor]